MSPHTLTTVYLALSLLVSPAVLWSQTPERLRYEELYAQLTSLAWWTTPEDQPYTKTPAWRPWARGQEPNIGFPESPPCLLRSFSQAVESDGSIWWWSADFEHIRLIPSSIQTDLGFEGDVRLPGIRRIGRRLGTDVAEFETSSASPPGWFFVAFKSTAARDSAKNIFNELISLCSGNARPLTREGVNVSSPPLSSGPRPQAEFAIRLHWPGEFIAPDPNAPAPMVQQQVNSSTTSSGETRVYSATSEGVCTNNILYYVEGGRVYARDAITGARTTQVVKYIIGDTVYARDAQTGGPSSRPLYYIVGEIVYASDALTGARTDMILHYVADGRVYAADAITRERTTRVIRCIAGSDRTD